MFLNVLFVTCMKRMRFFRQIQYHADSIFKVPTKNLMGKPNLLTLLIAGSALDHSKAFKSMHFGAKVSPTFIDTTTQQKYLFLSPKQYQFAVVSLPFRQYKRMICTQQSFCGETRLYWPNFFQSKGAHLNVILSPYFKMNVWTRSRIMAMYNIRGICQFRKRLVDCVRRCFTRVATFTYFSVPALHP